MGDLRGIDLTHEELPGADLVHARLDGARLDDCGLTEARLDFATLSGASLSLARLDGASLMACVALGMWCGISGRREATHHSWMPSCSGLAWPVRCRDEGGAEEGADTMIGLSPGCYA
ncbi:pentapeptide repeat-containing protein [Corallococcus interemptor]|uniref:pentapeptide repeat-containing protein n=1 Tax=Corallococcus interemptor TaxID=2316720 RepID=UPI0034CEB5E8